MTRKLLPLKCAPCLLAGLTLIPAASAQPAATKHYTTKFEVSITKRASALQPAYQVMGELGIDLNPDGTFTCQISPLQGLTDVPTPPSVVVIGGKFVADGSSSLNCSGQITGRLIGITIDMDDNYKIYGTGVVPTDFSKLPAGPITVAFGGTAATSVPGDGGDWYTSCVTVKLYNPFTGAVVVDKTVCVTISLN